LAFGTGTHPTTALCLNWLDQQDLQHKQLVDYGCGSGILGIAALLLGANIVYGVDNDPQALVATHNNCEKNQLALEQFPVLLPVDFVEQIKTGKLGQSDIVMANILAGPLIKLAPYLSALVKPGGRILLSGILEEQAAAVSEAYQAYFNLNPPVIQEGWVRISGQALD
jgi:ribosomal protein L11 methyltransferase